MLPIFFDSGHCLLSADEQAVNVSTKWQGCLTMFQHAELKCQNSTSADSMLSTEPSWYQWIFHVLCTMRQVICSYWACRVPHYVDALEQFVLLPTEVWLLLNKHFTRSEFNFSSGTTEILTCSDIRYVFSEVILLIWWWKCWKLADILASALNHSLLFIIICFEVWQNKFKCNTLGVTNRNCMINITQCWTFLIQLTIVSPFILHLSVSALNHGCSNVKFQPCPLAH